MLHSLSTLKCLILYHISLDTLTFDVTFWNFLCINVTTLKVEGLNNMYAKVKVQELKWNKQIILVGQIAQPFVAVELGPRFARKHCTLDEPFNSHTILWWLVKGVSSQHHFWRYDYNVSQPHRWLSKSIWPIRRVLWTFISCIHYPLILSNHTLFVNQRLSIVLMF